MTPSSKSEAKKDKSSKPKGDYKTLKALEASDISSQKLPVNLNHMIWRNLPVLVLADVLKALHNIIDRWIHRMSNGNTCLHFAFGASNQPTFPNNESFTGYLISVEKMIVSYASLSRGMFVSFRSPICYSEDSEAQFFIKRIIGLPGDFVLTRKGRKTVTLVKISAGYFWAEGDAGEGSLDSTDFGPIPLKLLLSTTTHIVFPFNVARRLRWWEYDISHRIIQDQQQLQKWEQDGFKFKFTPTREVQKDLDKATRWRKETGLEKKLDAWDKTRTDFDLRCKMKGFRPAPQMKGSPLKGRLTVSIIGLLAFTNIGAYGYSLASR